MDVVSCLEPSVEVLLDGIHHRLEEADRLCQQALAASPEHPVFWERVADLEERRGEVEASRRARAVAKTSCNSRRQSGRLKNASPP